MCYIHQASPRKTATNNHSAWLITRYNTPNDEGVAIGVGVASEVGVANEVDRPQALVDDRVSEADLDTLRECEKPSRT